MYINRIEILDEGDIEMVGRIKQKLRKILTEGIEILDHWNYCSQLQKYPCWLLRVAMISLIYMDYDAFTLVYH